MLSGGLVGLVTLFKPTSTNFIKGTGLKKCSPPNLSFLFVTLAISLMGSDEVLDTKMAWLKINIIQLELSKLFTPANESQFIFIILNVFTLEVKQNGWTDIVTFFDKQIVSNGPVI